MPEKNISISSPRKGMNTDKSPIDLTETEYTFSLNSNIASDVGDTFLLQDEPSNILCNNFPQGFVIIGEKYEVNSNRTYFFLTNPLTKVSEIGYIDNINNVINADDIESECNCNIKNLLAEPLEGQVQTPTCTYTTLLNDSCNLCLNFSTQYPIRKIIVKYEFSGTTLWWTDGRNTMRYLQVDELDQYKVTGLDSCGEDNTTPTCLDCEKLKVSKDFNQPIVIPTSIQQGGRLKAGEYEVLIAYSDINGNELSSYYNNTNPIAIFDENNTIISQPELEYETNFGIKLNIENLDRDYPYYKIAIIYSGGISGVNYYEGEVRPTSDNEIIITSLNNLRAISLQKLSIYKKVYDRADGLTSSNGLLYWHGTKEQEEINFQPCANLLGGFLRWITVEAKEDLYKDGVNSSIYKSYLRDEVYPFSIQLLYSNGGTSADFPLINRPPTSFELEEVNNTDTQSINTYGSNCSDADRTKRFQYYNTAQDLGFWGSEELDNYNTVERETKRSCVVESVENLSNLTLTLPCDFTYTNFFNYIANNRDEICNSQSILYNSELCTILSDTYSGQNCDVEALFEENCGTPTLIDGSTEVYLDSVEAELIEVEYEETSSLEPTPPPSLCNMYKAGTNEDGYENDTAFEEAYMPVGEQVYKRNDTTSNTLCQYALTTTYVEGLPNPSIFLQYDGALTVAELQTNKTSLASGDFTSFIHTRSLWYKVLFGDQDKMAFEVTGKSECDANDDISSNDGVRFTTFNSCSDTAYIQSGVVNLAMGMIVELDKADYPSGTAYIAIDSPLKTKVTVEGTRYIISPPCGCFSVTARNYNCASKTVEITNAVFSKREDFIATCEYRVPINNNCDPLPYKYGKFGYTESSRTYPDNPQLYNSNSLIINESEIPVQYRNEFREYYISDGQLSANFVCQPIRHYKFPDFSVSPFMSTEQLTPFSDSIIYPIGVSLDEELIQYFLNVAVDSGLMTQQQRDLVVGYKIKAGDRTLNKSIIAKGLANDMFSYTEPGATNPSPVLFPNFPYNDNHENILLYTDINRNSFIQHPNQGTSNNNYTFHSPETSFTKPTLPTELKIEAYQFGHMQGNFVNVEDHVKEVVLGDDAYTLATTLALAEVALETALKVSDFILAAGNQFVIVIGGTATGGGTNNAAGASTLAAVAFGAATALNGFLTVGQYRKQWLDIIDGLGQPKNFASYLTSVGKYNYAIANTVVGQSMRAIKTSKYLKPANYQFTEETTGETVKINNRDRESSVFISTGEDYPVIYPSYFSQFDNSRTIASESVGCENVNVSSTLERQIASAYFSIKNYIVDQYGGINDVKWINTGYTGDLTSPKSFPQIFGGDIFISRFAKKIKHPIFKTTAIGLADRTPFNYSIEANVGVPRFYADFYATRDGGGIGAALFPNINTDYNFDCLTGSNKTYVKNPSKFYTAYYGIPYFLVESEINNNYRYAREGQENNFYPNTEDFINWTQEKNVPIRQDNTFFYNFIYSKKTTQIGNRSLPVDYDTDYFRKITYQPNNTFWSLPDNSDIDRFEPWLGYRPLDFYNFKAELGRLVDLADIESAQIIGRFENGMLRYNSIDVLAERITPETVELGTGGIFAKRPIEFKRTGLGYSGTQHVSMVSSEFGHFWADAKRGQVFQLDQNGEQLKDITEGKTRWFKEQLPFKMLKSIPNSEIDNASNGIGLAMVWDSKYKRVFLTKKDYIPTPCIQYDEELGYVKNETLCGAEPIITCPEGYIYNPTSQMCEKEITTQVCPEGYIFNAALNVCQRINSTPIAPCPPSLGYFAGGVFTSPNQRLFNSEVATPAVNNGSILTFKRDSLGRILIGGNFTTVAGNTINGLFRINYNGTIDNTFDIGLGFSNTISSMSVNAIDIYEDGRIMVGGQFTSYNGNTANGIVRLTSNGDYDATFDSTVGFSSQGAYDIRIVENEKILVATVNALYNGQPTKGLFKLLPNGQIDPSFGGGTRFAATVNGSQRCESIEVDSQGRYIIGNRNVQYNGIVSKKIVRLFPNGELDTTFNVGEGFGYPGQDEFNFFLYRVQMQGDKILAAGRFETYKGQPAVGIVRLNPDGSLDSSFNNNKVITGGSSIVDRTIFDFDTDQEGEILIGGNFTGYSGNSIPYIALTDVNGFPVAFTNPNINNIILSVQNAPKCEQCEQPCYLENDNGELTCNCVESTTPFPCIGDCGIQNGLCTCTISVEPSQQDILTPVDLSDTEYFEEASWTMAYSPLTESWISYYSFKPNYYVAHQDYFQSGLNYGDNKGIWSHLLTNRSYRVFYGDAFDWTIELPTKPSLDKKTLENVQFILDSERYHNEYDSAPLPKIGFTSMVVYNATNNSGVLKLVEEEKNNIYQKLQYPKTNIDNQEILVTKYDDIFNVNYIYNRVNSENNNIVNWLKDNVDVEKEVNIENITYKSPLPERMKGNWFLVRFYKTGNTQIKSVMKFTKNNERLYP